jgi:adenylylsulfate kinase-like enzyme
VKVLAERDVKGLYKKALAGEIPHFTGVSDPYEAPLAPDVEVDSSTEKLEDSIEKVIGALRRLGFAPENT